MKILFDNHREIECNQEEFLRIISTGRNHLDWIHKQEGGGPPGEKKSIKLAIDIEVQAMF